MRFSLNDAKVPHARPGRCHCHEPELAAFEIHERVVRRTPGVVPAVIVVEQGQVGDHDFSLYQDSNDLLACDANPLIDCHASGGSPTGMYTVVKAPAGKYHLVVDADRPGKEGGVVLQLSGVPNP